MFNATAQFHRSTTGSSSPAARAGWPSHILEEQSLSKLFQHPGKETYGADQNLALFLELASGLTFVVGE